MQSIREMNTPLAYCWMQVAKKKIRTGAEYRKEAYRQRQPKRRSKSTMKGKMESEVAQRRRKDRDNLRNKLNYANKRAIILQNKYTQERAKVKEQQDSINSAMSKPTVSSEDMLDLFQDFAVQTIDGLEDNLEYQRLSSVSRYGGRLRSAPC